jgi:hypothetical protein
MVKKSLGYRLIIFMLWLSLLWVTILRLNSVTVSNKYGDMLYTKMQIFHLQRIALFMGIGIKGYLYEYLANTVS